MTQQSAEGAREGRAKYTRKGTLPPLRQADTDSDWQGEKLASSRSFQ